MADEQIAHLRKLLADATPGPWEATDFVRDNKLHKMKISTIQKTPLGSIDAHDARLIVALRNSATAMLDEIERLRGALQYVQPIMRDYHGWVMANDLDMTFGCPDECLGEAADELARILFPNEPHDARAALGDE